MKKYEITFTEVWNEHRTQVWTEKQAQVFFGKAQWPEYRGNFLPDVFVRPVSVVWLRPSK